MSIFSNKSLIVFFVAMMIMAGTLLYGSYTDLKEAHLKTKEVIEVQELKQDLLTTMYSSARERSLILLKMYAKGDPFELDDLNQELGKHARAFITARQKLMGFKLTEEERSILEKQNELTLINAPLQNEVAQLFIEEKRERAESLLFDTAIPGQDTVLLKISSVLSYYKENAIRSIVSINKDYEHASNKFQLLGITLLGSCAMFALFVIIVSQRERKKLEVLLAKQKRISAQLDRSSEQLSYQASHDGLTGLINREEYEVRLHQLINRTEGGSNSSHVALYLDLDQFKIVNDTCGHVAGDALLKEISAVMKPFIRKPDVLARLGGDEFGILLEYCELPFAEKVAQSLIQAVNEFRFRWDNKTFRIGVSIGIARVDRSTYIIDDILKQIDTACYAAKEAGRNRYHIYVQGDKDLLLRESEMEWVRRIEIAHEEKRFVIYAQEITSISQSSTSKKNYEVLIRLRSNDGSIIPPGAFLPASERYNKIIPIDCWVIEKAISVLAANPKFLSQIGYCSVNISCHSLTDPGFLNSVVEMFDKHENMAQKICFEITETAAIINLLQANKSINTLRSMGLRFALDDFGSGLSSFGYLKTLPVDYLKIDGMFVKDIVSDPIDYAMVKSIHDIGSLMGMKTVAEFVENDEILEHLRTIGVDYAQGYGIGKPEPLPDIIESTTGSYLKE